MSSAGERPSMGVTVRTATPDDAEAIAAVHRASIRGLAAEAYDEAVIEAWSADKEPGAYPIGEKDVHFVVAERRDEVIGFGEAHPEPADYLRTDADGEVRAVYVHPAATRQGVGSAVLAELERRAHRAGVTSLGLWASLNAVPFYEARGYRRVGERTHEFGGSVPGPAVEMHKRLVAPDTGSFNPGDRDGGP